MLPAVGGELKCPSVVCSSLRRATAVGCRHAGCLQLSHFRTADPSVDGRRSATSRTANGGGAYRLAAPRAMTVLVSASEVTNLWHYTNLFIIIIIIVIIIIQKEPIMQ